MCARTAAAKRHFFYSAARISHPCIKKRTHVFPSSTVALCTVAMINRFQEGCWKYAIVIAHARVSLGWPKLEGTLTGSFVLFTEDLRSIQ